MNWWLYPDQMQEITQYWHPCAVLLVDVKAQHMLDEENHLKVCAVPVFLHAFFFFPPCVGHFFRAYYSKNCWNLLPSVTQWKVKSAYAWQYPLLTKLFYKRLLRQLRCSILRVKGACGFFIVKITCYSGRKMLG